MKIQKLFLLGLALVVALACPALSLDNPEEKITQLIKGYVGERYPEWADLETRVTFKYADKTFEKLSSMDGGAELKIADVYKDLKPVGNVIFPIEITTGDGSRKVFVRAKVEVFKKVVVALRSLKRGTLISVDDIKLEERDIAMLPQNYFADFEGVLLRETKTAVARNSTIFEWMIKEIPIVRRGDEVSILVKGPNMLVRTTGVALEDGYENKLIRVKVKGRDAKDRLEGRLVSSNEVEVIMK